VSVTFTSTELENARNIGLGPNRALRAAEKPAAGLGDGDGAGSAVVFGRGICCHGKCRASITRKVTA